VGFLHLIGYAATLAVVFLAADWWQLRRKRRAAQSDATAGKPPTVDAAIRLLSVDGGRWLNCGLWRGRWRHGFATISAEGIHWRPRWPRPGGPVHLGAVRVDGRRFTSWSEYWWVSPGMAIYEAFSADAPPARYELAIFPESAELLSPLAKQ